NEDCARHRRNQRRRYAFTYPSSVCFFTAPPPPAIYTLSLHDALPISRWLPGHRIQDSVQMNDRQLWERRRHFFTVVTKTVFKCGDRKSTRLNSSHLGISYAVFCLKKKNKRLFLLLEAMEHLIASIPER